MYSAAIVNMSWNIQVQKLLTQYNNLRMKRYYFLSLRNPYLNIMQLPYFCSSTRVLPIVKLNVLFHWFPWRHVVSMPYSIVPVATVSVCLSQCWGMLGILSQWHSPIPWTSSFGWLLRESSCHPGNSDMSNSYSVLVSMYSGSMFLMLRCYGVKWSHPDPPAP